MTPPAPLNLVDLLRSDFRASAAGDALNLRLQSELRLDFRYQPARLALALSLSDPRPPPPVEATGKPIRGETLFSPEQAELSTWVGLFAEHAGSGVSTRRALQDAVAAHWSRGIEDLWTRWSRAEQTPAAFLAGLSRAGEAPGRRGHGPFQRVSSLSRAITPASQRLRVCEG